MSANHFLNMRFFYIGLLSIVLLSACRKEQDNVLPPVQEVVQPIAQSIYRVNVYDTTTDGLILVSPYLNSQQNKGEVMIFNTKGELIQHKDVDGAVFCFRRWVIDGKIRYTYIVNDVNTWHIPNLNQLTGYAVIADSSLNEIKRVHLLPGPGGITPGANMVSLDVHDFILLSDDHYYTMSYYPKPVNNIPTELNPSATVSVISPVIQEVRNDVVVWQWDGTDYPEFYDVSVEGNDYTNGTVTQDYMHINSMTIDPKDGHLVCSFRNTDQVLKINSKTGDIVWRLGGKNSDFPLTNSQKFMRQHDATFINNNNTLLLFDNGEQTTRPLSRILELTLDETSKTVIDFKSYNIPAPFSRFMGSVQKIGDNYFIGGGTGNYVLYINPNTGKRSIEFLGDRPTYRAYFY